jgi:hypothetical protein
MARPRLLALGAGGAAHGQVRAMGTSIRTYPQGWALASHCARTASATCTNTPLARHSSATAACTCASRRLRASSEREPSCSYAPAAAAPARARFARLAPYVSSASACSAGRPARSTRGELWSRFADRTVRQLKPARGERGAGGGRRAYWAGGARSRARRRRRTR